MQRQLLSIAALVLLPTSVLANPGGLDSNLETEERIFNGQVAGLCAWPTTVAVQNGGSLCTGTLVHPQVVVYAAHCGAANTVVKFGESSGGGAGHSVQCQFSKVNPGYAGVANDQAHDWAVCLLAEPVVDLPITPVVYGCETGILTPGTEVAIAGFGQTENAGAGTKHWALTTLTSANLAQGVATLGGNGLPSVCPGDSGGPAFVRYPDKSWHAFGIASTVSGGCGGMGTHALMPNAVGWWESETGLDLTPCHDADQQWLPGPFCGNFYAAEPGMGHGTWSGAWCAGTPALALSETCGDPFGADDGTPPTVQITSPVDGYTSDECPDAFDILVDAEDESGYLKNVTLEVNDAVAASDTSAPWEFKGASFPEGQYKLVAIAEDYGGNVTRSAAVGVGICAEAPDVGDEEGEGDGDGDGDGDGTGSGPTTGLPGDEDGDQKGCGCVAVGVRDGAASVPAFGLALLLVGRRRRSRTG